jgi:predicted RNA-binding protein with RPS1 domain
MIAAKIIDWERNTKGMLGLNEVSEESQKKKKKDAQKTDKLKYLHGALRANLSR